jgi:hypothetical protein
MIIEEIKNIKETVTELLTNNMDLRDDDYKLISTIWYLQVKSSKLNQMSGFDFLKIHSEGKLICSESIRRCRALLQRNDPTLRGKNYKKRKNSGEDFSKDINEID